MNSTAISTSCEGGRHQCKALLAPNISAAARSPSAQTAPISSHQRLWAAATRRLAERSADEWKAAAVDTAEMELPAIGLPEAASRAKRLRLRYIRVLCACARRNVVDGRGFRDRAKRACFFKMAADPGSRRSSAAGASGRGVLSRRRRSSGGKGRPGPGFVQSGGIRFADRHRVASIRKIQGSIPGNVSVDRLGAHCLRPSRLASVQFPKRAIGPVAARRDADSNKSFKGHGPGDGSTNWRRSPACPVVPDGVERAAGGGKYQSGRRCRKMDCPRRDRRSKRGCARHGGRDAGSFRGRHETSARSEARS